MHIYIGSDHRGHHLKNRLTIWFEMRNMIFTDMGAMTYDKDDDFVDYAEKVAMAVSHTEDEDVCGIVICGSGVGVAIAADKVKGIRCALGYSEKQVISARHDDNCNVLALGSDFVTLDEAKKLIEAFIKTPFDEQERRVRRLDKITALEQKQ